MHGRLTSPIIELVDPGQDGSSGARLPAPKPGRWLLLAALGLFVLYALNFLYFFVDDEGIPFVYAQHLLRHQGFVYSALEGRAEGYSDFLHVVLATGILGAVRALGWPKITVFLAGQAISLAAGAGIVTAVFLALRRSTTIQRPGAIAGLAFVALSGPVALWSCSSLETALFAFLITALVCAMAGGAGGPTSAPLDRVAAAAAALAVLERIDGPIYVAAVLGSFWICADRKRRRAIAARVVAPVVLLTIAYHAWRVWYFQSLLPLPVYSKVVYKLWSQGHVLVKPPTASYLGRAGALYGWPATLLAAGAAAYAAWRSAAVRPVCLAAAAMLTYVAIVGDWMFGFRFLTPIVPLAAMLVGEAVSLLGARRRAVGYALAAIVLCWSGVIALRFETEYARTEGKESWLLHPSLDPARRFGTYYALMEAARTRMMSHALVAYNQSGFVPFMLDLDNVDNLGICSRFYAELPTTDVWFTEVGRYAPLTDRRSLRATDAYLLYRDVQFVMVRDDLIRNANNGQAPAELMGGYYAFVAGSGGDVIYERTSKPTDQFRTDPTRFFENLAHISHLRGAAIDGRALATADLGPRLPFLREATGEITVRGRWVFDADLSDAGERAYEIDLNTATSNAPVTVVITLESSTGAPPLRERFDVDASGRHIFQSLPGAQASHIRMEILGPPDRAVHVWLTDLRLQGQTRRLAAYIRDTLRFAPDSRDWLTSRAQP